MKIVLQEKTVVPTFRLSSKSIFKESFPTFIGDITFQDLSDNTSFVLNDVLLDVRDIPISEFSLSKGDTWSWSTTNKNKVFQFTPDEDRILIATKNKEIANVPIKTFVVCLNNIKDYLDKKLRS